MERMRLYFFVIIFDGCSDWQIDSDRRTNDKGKKSVKIQSEMQNVKVREKGR